ncbi:hypothetical protein [Streptomyces sp. NRRL WC-3742]|uniref:hypothetical protein n=1 Tax=Streptomyces sp. NRRL WC-3742 TaxID=1463934 RepID=UPI0004C4E86D|nr:hypothetical protein [Streptomyces sp. NRRL WC-3742]
MSAPKLQPGVWCECFVHSPQQDEGPRLLASFEASTPAGAVRWMRVAVRLTVSALEGPEAEAVEDWLFTGQAAAVDALNGGEPYAFAVRHRHTRVEWTARPVLFAPLADRQAAVLPPCAYRFTPPSPAALPPAATP